MPAVSYDGRSFQIDGRRLWLVSRTFEYFKYSPDQWLGILKGFKASGYSGVSVVVPWARVEPAPGVFNFTQELNLQSVVKMAGEAGLYCVLNPGPANLPDAELGGMPLWLLGVAGMKLREGNPAFLSAVSRYYSAIWEQVRDLQATGDIGPGSSSKTGPILLVRLEGEWMSHQREESVDYLGELARFHREDGCRVPLVLSNRMWHQLDTVVSAWNTDGKTLSTARQLGAAQPQAPRLFLDLVAHEGAAAVSAGQVAQALAGGAQFNLAAEASGVDGQARALLQFGSSFGFLFANLNPSGAAVIDPGMTESQPGVFSLVGQGGSQGEVVFLFGKANKAGHVAVMLADGRKTEMAVGAQGVAWGVMDARLPGLGSVTTMMSPMAWHLKKMLVVKAQEQGQVIVAGTTVQVPAATEKAASVVSEQGVVIVGLTQAQSERFWPVSDGVVVGPAGLDRDGNPDLATAGKGAFHVGLDGKLRPLKAGKAAAEGKGAQISAWRVARATEGVFMPGAFAKGSAERTVEGVNAPVGAAWHEVTLAKGVKESKLIAPEWGDEVALYSPEGKLIGRMTGENPRLKAAVPERAVIFSSRSRVLWDWPFQKASGPVGGLYAEGGAIKVEVTQTQVPKVDLWEHQPYLPSVHKLAVGRLSQAYKAMFKTNAARVWLRWPIFEMPSVVLVNGQFAGMIAGLAQKDLVLDEARGLKRGSNEVVVIDIFRVGLPQEVVAKKNAPELVELGADVLAGGTWKALAPIVPADDAFVDAGKAKLKGGPAWFKCLIKMAAPKEPVMLTLDAQVKNVVFNGKRVGPAMALKKEADGFLLDPSMFDAGGTQELVLLSMEAKTPGKVKLAGG